MCDDDSKIRRGHLSPIFYFKIAEIAATHTKSKKELKMSENKALSGFFKKKKKKKKGKKKSKKIKVQDLTENDTNESNRSEPSSSSSMVELDSNSNAEIKYDSRMQAH